MRKKNILFGYSCTPAFGIFGKDKGGFSVEISMGGLLTYKTYIFDKRETSKRTMQLSDDILSAIFVILEEKAEMIQILNSRLDNGSLDGVCNKFVFYEKEIISWNIEYISEEMFEQLDEEYCREYEKNIWQENEVFNIFEKIAEVLKNKGILLTLYDAKIEFLQL